MNADIPLDGADSPFSSNGSGIPLDESTLPRWFTGSFDDLLGLLNNDESAAFESEGQRQHFWHTGIKRASRYWEQPKPCVVPGCDQQSIVASHTLQRGGPLAVIAENQHVFAPEYDWRTDGIMMRAIGIGEASTFPGFCRKHEQLFAAFESKGTLEKAKDIALQVFRSICREVVRKRASIWEWEQAVEAYDKAVTRRGMTFMKARLGEALFERITPQITSFTVTIDGGRKASVIKAIESTRAWVRTVEQHFLMPSYAEITCDTGGLAHLTIRVLSQIVPVCMAGTANFGMRQDGQESDVPVFVNVWPTKDQTLISIAAERANEKYLPVYVNSFVERPLGLLTMLETWMVWGTDHWFIKPSIWKGLPKARQERILIDLADIHHNIGNTYGVSIFDDIRRDMLALPDASDFPPEMLMIECHKLVRDR